jgi:3-hydroxy acid dehydrogenase / malonic semialdehyde reductase
MSNLIAFITGATSGIGLSCAHMFAQNGYDLILIGRRGDRLYDIQDELSLIYGVECFVESIDVRSEPTVNIFVRDLPDKWKNIDVLVNNAGLALGLSTIDDGNTDDWNTMIDTNVKGLLYISKAVMPLMIKRKHGHIINIGSIAGREVYPKGNVYCATKHAVDAISQSMRIDLLEHNIRVTQVSPGAVETEFSVVRYKGDAQKANDVYNGFTPLSPDDVAHVVYYCASLPQHVNINDVLVMPTNQACAGIINKKL